MPTAQNLMQEHKWMVAHPEEIEEHRGKWIAILDGKIIATGNSYEKVFKEVKHFMPEKYPLITYILKKEEENLIAQ